MKTRLRTFAFVPRLPNGLGTSTFHFGAGTTLVTGENGAGKTPMLRGLAYALGAKTELPQFVVANCAAVRLTLENEHGVITVVERSLEGKSSQITTKEGTTRINDEVLFAARLLEVLGIPPRSLVTRPNNEPSSPYVSLLAPLFYVDQDHGWRDLYAPPPNLNFVVDQAEECVRWILGVPQRNSSRSRKERDGARRAVESLRDQLDRVRRSVESYRKQAGDDAKDGARVQLEERRRVAVARLTSLVESYDGLARVDAAIDGEIRDAAFAVNAVTIRMSTLTHQATTLQRTRDELISETSVLEANQVAANVFREFCGNTDCNLFRPQDSYGRRLLYLRDQLKDIDTMASLLAVDVTATRDAVAVAETGLHTVQERRRKSVAAQGGAVLATEIEALSKEIAATAVRLDRLNTLDEERRRLVSLMLELQKAEEEATAMASVRGASGGERLADARAILARSTLKWLTALNARNLGGDVRFDVNLNPLIAGEKFSPASAQSGSTRTRIVLALHAALVETSLEMGGYHPWFLILDAPKQQELHPDHLAAFVTGAQDLFNAQAPPMQLIVGAKERDIFVRKPDATWEPAFESSDGHHYLGQVS